MTIPATLQQLGRNQMQMMLQPVRQMMNMVHASQNPQAALNQLVMSNPQMKQVMDIVNRYGGDEMKALEDYAAQFGMTANDVLAMLRG